MTEEKQCNLQNDTFLEKYGFKMTITKPHPTHKDIMTFNGLEADYVSTLEHTIKEQQKYIDSLLIKIDYLTTKEVMLWKDRK